MAKYSGWRWDKPSLVVLLKLIYFKKTSINFARIFIRDKKSPGLPGDNFFSYRALIISKSSLADFSGPSVSIPSTPSWVLIWPTFLLFS